MEKGLKIVTIGGGSSYTPELMEGFIKRYNELPIKEIWLVDIEQGKEKVNIDAKMSQRMWDAAGYDVKVHVSFDRREALKDAVNIPWWRSHPIHENRATKSIWTEPCNPLLRATKSTKRATSA